MNIKLLKDLLRENNLSHEEFAYKIGVNRETVTGYLVGRRKPRHETLKAMADYFKITTDDLLGREMEVELNENAK